MAEENSFDPYRKWLGIPPHEQPPNHYRLLGLDLFEADTDVISNAADARMVHLKTFATGKHSEASQQVLNEVASAQLCLLNPKKKAAYDKDLKEQLAAAGIAVPGGPPVAPPKQGPTPPPLPSQRPPGPPAAPTPPEPPEPPPLMEPSSLGIDVGTRAETSTFASSYVASQKKQKWVRRLILVVIVLIVVVVAVVIALTRKDDERTSMGTTPRAESSVALPM